MTRTPMIWLTPARLACLLACPLAGCLSLPDFDDPSLIDRPRVLAIVAEPPEARPGQDVRLSLLLAGAADAEIEWRVCGAFDELFDGNNQYGENRDDEGCGFGFAVDLAPGGETMLDGTLTEGLFDNLELAVEILGGTLPEEIVTQIRNSVGIPMLIEATVFTQGKQLRAIKRVLLSESPTPHKNPPPPRFMLGDTEIERDLAAPFGCAATDGKTPRVPREAAIELAPLVGGQGEDWLESYRVITTQGELTERTERAFYSWYSTTGSFEEGVTKSPLRNNVWHTPKDAEDARLWLVMRDGRGGTSACGMDVRVE